MSRAAFVTSPTCTTGPYFPVEFAEDCGDLTQFDGKTARGQHILLAGRVLEAGNAPTVNTAVEIWQPDASGVLRHPLDPRYAEIDPGFLGWGRAITDREGWYRFRTVLPGSYRTDSGAWRCPHINVTLLAVGLTRRLVTTIFFADAPETVDDPVLNCVQDAAARFRLFPQRDPAADAGSALAYRFDIVLQGENETPFFLD